MDNNGYDPRYGTGNTWKQGSCPPPAGHGIPDAGDQPSQGYYRSYSTPAQYGYPQQYSAYVPNNFPTDSFAVSPAEKNLLKKQHSGAYIRGFLHAFGTSVIAAILFTVTELFGHEYRVNAEGTQIYDWFYCLIGSLPSLIMCLSIYLTDKLSFGIKTRDIMRTDRISGKFIFGFFGMVMLMYGLSVFLQNIVLECFFAFDISPISEDYLSETEFSTPYLVIETIATVIAAPICEELMFRGVILRRLSAMSGRYAIIVSAAIFGLMHGNLLQAILGFLVGLVLGYAAVKTSSLVLPIAGHMFINLTAVSVTYAEYFFGKGFADSYWTACIILFSFIGFTALLIVLAKRGIRLPESSDYHKRRTLPIGLACVSFWVLFIYYAFDIVSKFGPLTEKLMAE